MARYIDADALIVEGWHLERQAPSGKVLSMMSIADVPTADVEEVKHGEWEHRKWMDDFQHICSVCHSTSRVHPESVPYKYCPYCGAKMDGGKAE